MRINIATRPESVRFQPMCNSKKGKAAGCIVLAVFLGGCGSEQSVQRSDRGSDTVSASPVVEPPAIQDLDPAATKTVVVNDPLLLEPKLDAAPVLSGQAGEESVDDILAELNAIQLDGEEGNPLGDPDKVVALLHEGNTLISAGQPDAALAKYDEAMKFAEKEGDPDLFFNKGIAYKAKGETDKAIAEYRRALELAPDYAEAHNNLGNLLKDQKKYDEAIVHFESSIRVFPDNPTTHNNLGTVFAMKGNVNKAAVYFAKAVRLKPTYIDARQNLGLAYQQQERFNVAEKELGEVLQMTMGMKLQAEKRLEAAKVMLDQAKKPGSPLTFEQRNRAGGELEAAEQAITMANAKHQRSLKLLQNVRVRQQSAVQR